MEDLPFLTSVPYVKSNYAPIQDDVVLAPMPTYVEAEPQPDNVIIVELAGQWPNTKAHFSVGKTEEQALRSAMPVADPKANHRSVVTFKSLTEEPRNLYLTIPVENFPNPMQLLLAENVVPTAKEEDKEEWETVLIPLMPFYTVDGGAPDNLRTYDNGYLYVIWKGEVWREVCILPNGYLRDVNVNYYRNKQPATKLDARYANIILSDHRTGELLEFAEYDVYQEGEHVYQGVADEYGKARLFGLQAEEVEVKCPEHQLTFTVKTQPSPNLGGKQQFREADGMPLPHLLVPYKVEDAQEPVYLHYSQHQLTLAQLTDLENAPEEHAVELSGLAEYSEAQQILAEGEPVSKLMLPTTDHHFWIEDYLETGVAAVILDPPAPRASIKYRPHHSDQLDDGFMLRDEENDWTQYVTMREMVTIVDDSGELSDAAANDKMIYFSGWPEETETVDLLRFYNLQQSTDSEDDDAEVASMQPSETRLIHQAVPIADLLT